jgi:hypothetical protein
MEKIVPIGTKASTEFRYPPAVVIAETKLLGKDTSGSNRKGETIKRIMRKIIFKNAETIIL